MLHLIVPRGWRAAKYGRAALDVGKRVGGGLLLLLVCVLLILADVEVVEVLRRGVGHRARLCSAAAAAARLKTQRPRTADKKKKTRAAGVGVSHEPVVRSLSRARGPVLFVAASTTFFYPRPNRARAAAQHRVAAKQESRVGAGKLRRGAGGWVGRLTVCCWPGVPGAGLEPDSRFAPALEDSIDWDICDRL